jgi:hypothetical protein
MALTLTDLQPLLNQFKGEGSMISCYIDLSAKPGIPVKWPAPFKAKVAAVKEMLANDAPAWHQFEENFQAVGRALTQPEASHARGLAVFAARQRDFFRSYALDVPVENDLIVHGSPYLVPLFQAMCRQREYLVVLTDTHRGRLYGATPGGLRLIQEIEEDVPSRQRSSGQRWGMEQATIAQHRQDRILHYQKELVQGIERAWAAHPFQGILLLGEHEVLEHVRKLQPARTAAQVVYEGPQAWTDKPAATMDAVRSALADVTQKEETRLAAQVQERLREGYGLAAGPAAVIEALQTGRVSPRGHGSIVLGPDAREVVARCTACRSLFVDMPANCPRCQAPCADANLCEEVLLLALRHDIAVHCLPAGRLPERCAGMAALLAGPLAVTPSGNAVGAEVG